MHKFMHARMVREHSGPQSSQLAEPLWTDPGLKSGVSVRELISTSKKKKKKRRRGMNGRTFSQKSSQARKKPPLSPCVVCTDVCTHTRAHTHTHTHAHTQILHYLVSTDHRHIAEQLNAHSNRIICNIKVHVR